jgi:hypothetical protein
LKYFYVICPVGTDPDFATKRSALEALGSERAIEPFFPLERGVGFSIDTVSLDMGLAEFVLADLSFERPSCYFELGLAKAGRVKVALIAAKGTAIHQVGDHARVGFYRDFEEYCSLVSTILDRLSVGAADAGGGT